MKKLIIRLRRMSVLLFIGILAIICVGLAIVYFQQGVKQKELEAQISKMNVTLLKPLSSTEQLMAEYDESQHALASLTQEQIIDLLADIAADSGIDINPASRRYVIPSLSAQNVVKEVKVGNGKYQVTSLKNVMVQGDYASVMNFISSLESGTMLKGLVINKLTLGENEVTGNVASAVKEMMQAHNIDRIPNSVPYSQGIAVNDMNVFPDSTTTPSEKGTDVFGGTVSGYRLFGDEVIVDINGNGVLDRVDWDGIISVNHINVEKTKYYYTCEADGTVRQFDGPDIATAREFSDTDIDEVIMETVVTVDIDVYATVGG